MARGPVRDRAALLDAVERGGVDVGRPLPDRYDERVRDGEDIESSTCPRRAPSDRHRDDRPRPRRARGGEIRGADSWWRSWAFRSTSGSRSCGPSPPRSRRSSRLDEADRPVGESAFPSALRGFALGAQAQLVLFVFLTSLTGAAQLILTQDRSASRGACSPRRPRSARSCSARRSAGSPSRCSRRSIIVGATALLFGVAWGDPLGATAVVLAFSMVAAGVAMLIGAVANNAEQASSIGVVGGLGVAAIGGSMVPPEIFPEPMATISWLRRTAGRSTGSGSSSSASDASPSCRSWASCSPSPRWCWRSPPGASAPCSLARASAGSPPGTPPRSPSRERPYPRRGRPSKISIAAARSAGIGIAFSAR